MKSYKQRYYEVLVKAIIREIKDAVTSIDYVELILKGVILIYAIVVVSALMSMIIGTKVFAMLPLAVSSIIIIGIISIIKIK